MIAGHHQLMHEKVRNLPCERIECDEIWSYARAREIIESYRIDYNTA